MWEWFSSDKQTSAHHQALTSLPNECLTFTNFIFFLYLIFWNQLTKTVKPWKSSRSWRRWTKISQVNLSEFVVWNCLKGSVHKSTSGDASYQSRHSSDCTMKDSCSLFRFSNKRKSHWKSHLFVLFHNRETLWSKNLQLVHNVPTTSRQQNT